MLSRTGRRGDVTLDAAGAAAAVGVALWGWQRAATVATTVLLWIVVLGGVLLLGLNLWTGVPSGVLWLVFPLAAALLLLRRWRRAAARQPGAGLADQP